MMVSLGDWLMRMRDLVGLPEVPVDSTTSRLMSNFVIDANNVVKYVGKASASTNQESDEYQDFDVADKLGKDFAKYLKRLNGGSQDVSDEEIAEARMRLSRIVAYQFELRNKMNENGLVASTSANAKMEERSFLLNSRRSYTTDDVSVDFESILRLLEVERPAGKILIELRMQDEELGDETQSILLLASKLLKTGDQLMAEENAVTSVILGYRLACREACKYVESQLAMNADELDKECLINFAKKSISIKLSGLDEKSFASMVVDAVMAVKISDQNGGWLYPIEVINVVKIHEEGAKESILVRGYGLNSSVIAEAMPKKMKDAKIACLDFSLQKTKIRVPVSVKDPVKLEAIRKRECDMTKKKIEKILAPGTNVILVSGDIDDSCLKYIVDAGAMAVRRVKMSDLEGIAKATGATVITSPKNEKWKEVFDSSCVGEAAGVVQESICGHESLMIVGPKAGKAASIFLYGPNEFYCNEMERWIHNALRKVKGILESKSVVASGGAFETATSVYLESIAADVNQNAEEELAFRMFARSLLLIPAMSAGRNINLLMGDLWSYHHAGADQENPETVKWFGLDLQENTIRNNKEAGIVEPAMSKVKLLKYATGTAIMMLKFDEVLRSELD